MSKNVSRSPESKGITENMDGDFPNIRKVLLVGYNGANNTGSEARLIAIIEDVRAVLGPEVHITVPTGSHGGK